MRPASASGSCFAHVDSCDDFTGQSKEAKPLLMILVTHVIKAGTQPLITALYLVVLIIFIFYPILIISLLSSLFLFINVSLCPIKL